MSRNAAALLSAMLGLALCSQPALGGFGVGAPLSDGDCELHRGFTWNWDVGPDSRTDGVNWETVLNEIRPPGGGHTYGLTMSIQHIDPPDPRVCDDYPHGLGTVFNINAGSFNRPPIGTMNFRAGGAQEIHSQLPHVDIITWRVQMRHASLGGADGIITLKGKHFPSGQKFLASYHNLDTQAHNVVITPSYRNAQGQPEDGDGIGLPDPVPAGGEVRGIELPRRASDDAEPSNYRVQVVPKPPQQPQWEQGVIGTTETTLAFLGEVNGIASELDLGAATDAFLDGQEFLAPSFGHPTLDLYVGIDLTQWVVNPMPFEGGDTFSFVNGVSEMLPGILVGTSPISFSNGGWTTESPYTGTLEVTGAIDGIPEPGTLLLLGITAALARRARPTPSGATIRC